jgi:hypothetical protein
MSNDTRRERLTTITRLLFPSYEVAAVEWLFNMRALYSLAAVRFDGDTARALRWLEPAFAELTPASLLCAIRTRMPLEATSATTHLADRITALIDHFFLGSSEYSAYLWLNDVAKLAELARLVREGDLPATFAWIAPAMDLAAEIRSATKGLVTPAPESEEQPLDVWKEDFRAWRNEFSAWQHAHHADRVSKPPYAPIIIQPPPPPSISMLGYESLRVRNPSPSPRRSESSVGHHRRSRSRSRSPVAPSQAPTSVLPTMVPPPNPQAAPVNIFMPGYSRSGRSRSGSRSRSRTPPVITIRPKESRFGTEGDGHPHSRTRTQQSFSPGRTYIVRDGREYRMEPVRRSPSYSYGDRCYDDDGRGSWSHSRQRAASELPLVDGGRPDIITATVKSAAVKGKPSRPKRARTALASLAGK